MSDDKKRALLRKQVETCFQHANKIMSQEGYDFNYATDLLSKCVNGDFANWSFAEKFLENLRKKYNNNGKGVGISAAVSGFTGRASIKKAIDKKDWAAAVKTGVDLLKNNPWDSATAALLAATAEGMMEGAASPEERKALDDSELRWLKTALTSSPNDADINRQCALALARRNQYDQAIACWRRVETAKKGDDEAAREISRLAVQKTRSHGGYDDANAGKQGAAPAPGAAPAKQEIELSPEQVLRQKIRKDPQTVQNYFDLSQLYITAENFKKATEILGEAMKIAEGNDDVRERYDDAKRRYVMQLLSAAEKKAEKSKSEADITEFKKLRKHLVLHELESYKFLCDRYPTNLTFKYELGERFKQLGDFTEAIKQFQSALSDPRKRGDCLLALAQCFQQIKKYSLAMTHFKKAVEEIPDRELDVKKKALYQAGKLALGLKERESAEKFLSALAQLDFGYKDVATLLDKVEELGHDNPSGSTPAASS